MHDLSKLLRNCILFGSLALTSVACTMPMDDDGTGNGSGSGSGSGGTWTAMPIPDDTSNPNETVYHQGNTRVTGIYYASPDKGIVVSQGDGETFSDGGAIFLANADAVTDVAFSGDNTGVSLDGAIDFVGIERTPTGYIAMAYASDVISSKDGGATFQIEKNGGATRFGIEPVIAYQLSSSGTTMIRKSGVVTTSTGTPGPSTTYVDVWAPNANPPMPNPVPDDMCQGGPLGTGVPHTRYSAYVSPDRNFIAYTSNRFHQPEICISTDGGRSFHPRALDVAESAIDYPATGVLFTNATTGLTWFAQPTADGGSYIKRTTDGGTTWTDIALPAEIASSSIDLPAGFFLPDGQHGWLAGYDYDAREALLLSTTDGGLTWSKVGGVGAAVEAAGGDKLFTVFALAPDQVYLGGARGLLMHN